MQIGVNINQVANRLNFGQIIFFYQDIREIKRRYRSCKKLNS
ncbi:plasmid mobilization relaxosome protein MobC [Carnobacterium sp.]